MTIRRALGSLVATLGVLLVVFSTVALLRPMWLQELYTNARDLYADSPLPLIAAGDRARETQKGVAVPGSGEPIGILEIPRLGLSSVVIEGDEAAALLLGVGHLSDTPLPGTSGNSVFAAHRDTFFRPLAGIRKGDTVLVTTPDGVHRYRVYATRIVQPSDVSVLRSGQQSQLTLVTCYPFDYVGSAPQRFIVQAELTPVARGAAAP